jgi:hypothetical protein
MNRIHLITCLAAAVLLASAAHGQEIVSTKHIIAAPAPIDEYPGAMTPDGSFNVRDAGAPFHSEALADAMGLDAAGRDRHGEYLNLNHAIYTAYRLAADPGPPDTVLILMPGTWAGSMSMDRFARDVLRMAAESGRKGIEVWLHDRRSEQLEDHTGLRWAEQEQDRLSHDQVIEGISAYYKPGFMPGDAGAELLGRRFTPLDQDAVRFMAGWGADVAVRDWRAVVLQAQRTVGNEVVGNDVATAVVKKKPGRHVFIGGHSLGGGLTEIYADYDFDRDPGREALGQDDVDGLVLLEGGGAKARPTKNENASEYHRKVDQRFRGGKVYFDLDILGIRYAPSTMLSVPIMGWAANVARGEQCLFPEYSRPRAAQLPRITNEGLLGYTMGTDFSPFFIARASIGFPTGELGGQLRRKIVTVPGDPGECPVLTPWRPGHRILDPSFEYGWKNIDAGPGPYAQKHPNGKCAHDDPQVTDVYDFARSLYAGPRLYEEAPWLATGPNDFPEWYFPPRLSSDSRAGVRVLDPKRGIELFNSSASARLSLPVISFTGDDSMGQFADPEKSKTSWAPAVLAHPETQVHLLKGYTHLDIPSATRNNQPDLQADGHANFNGCAVYAYRFMEAVGKRGGSY